MNEYEWLTFTCGKGTYYKIKGDLMKANIQIFDEEFAPKKIKRVKILVAKKEDALKVIRKTVSMVVGEYSGW